MDFKILLVFLLIKGLDGRYVVDSTNHQNQENNDNNNRILEKVIFTPIIIKGKVKSKLETSHYVEVNIKVTKIYKGKHQKIRHNFIRLKFEKSLWRENNPSQVNIKLGMNIIIYLSAQWKPIGMPNVFSRKLKRIITKYGCQDCVLPPRVQAKSRLQRLNLGHNKLRLRCSYQGNPRPIITWLKDGSKLEDKKRIKVITKRRKSILKIKSLKAEDRGTYTCHASSLLGNSSVTYKVDVIEKNPEVDSWRLCPIDEYCLNNGVCRMYPSIGEMICMCADGYVGKRCEFKSRPSVQR